jgi:hypothetical protein
MTGRPEPAVGASEEVLQHHLELHERDCGSGTASTTRVCPCKSCLVWACTRCGEPMFWTYKAWCEHAAALWASVQ